MTNAVQAQKFSDRDLIESIINAYYFIDYGRITKVNSDGTIDVEHAIKPELNDGTLLDPTTTQAVQVLTVTTAGISVKLELKEGDKVLLLALRDYIEDVSEVSQAKEAAAFIHYNRSTMKALPLCVFDDNAKIQVEVKNSDMTIKTGGKVTIADSNGTPALEVTP